MSLTLVIGVLVLYLGMLFGIAYLFERPSSPLRKVVSHPLIYALSMGVYCTAWTFYGSVGRAAESGPAFLPTYLGPVISAPIWVLFLRKIILVAKQQGITSVPD
ncbi:MAG: hypothetical protein D6772_12190, partial [Bacteroidetes bacterium]